MPWTPDFSYVVRKYLHVKTKESVPIGGRMLGAHPLLSTNAAGVNAEPQECNALYMINAVSDKLHQSSLRLQLLLYMCAKIPNPVSHLWDRLISGIYTLQDLSPAE